MEELNYQQRTECNELHVPFTLSAISDPQSFFLIMSPSIFPLPYPFEEAPKGNSTYSVNIMARVTK